jgi:hypothetical protein
MITVYNLLKRLLVMRHFSISVGTNSFLVADATVNVCVCVCVCLRLLILGQVALLSWRTEVGISTAERINVV